MKIGAGSKIKLGVFIFIGIVLFFTGVYYVGKSKNMFDTTFRITGIFHNVGGLQVGNNVRFSGINVGTVDAINIITDTTVHVDVIIEESLQKFIKSDSRAIIGSEGLMGNKVVNITPGSANSKMIEENGMITTIKPIDTDEILKDVKVSIENIKAISTDLGSIMNNIRRGKGTIGTLLVDTVFAGNIKQTISNLNKGTRGIESTMKSIKSGTDGFNGTVEAINNSFLLKGYFKKKEQAKEKGISDQEKLDEKNKEKLADEEKKLEQKNQKKLAKELKEKVKADRAALRDSQKLEGQMKKEEQIKKDQEPK